MRLSNSVLIAGIFYVVLGLFYLALAVYIGLLFPLFLGLLDRLASALETDITQVPESDFLFHHGEWAIGAFGLLVTVAAIALLRNHNWGRLLTPPLAMAVVVLAEVQRGYVIYRYLGSEVMMFIVLQSAMIALPLLLILLASAVYLMRRPIRAQFQRPVPRQAPAPTT